MDKVNIMFCKDNPKIKMIITVKKGMAHKALIKNMETSNMKRLDAQLKKGTVKIIK